jgi:ubiquinone/menaquinone biosynthesis C-methylase UbiE
MDDAHSQRAGDLPTGRGGEAAVADPTYVLGRSERETQRLVLQAELYGRVMRRFLEDAGVARGMSVLDVGSGAGDVSFTAAEIVGPTGRVVGIDTNSAVLATARERAVAERRTNVVFVEGDCRTAELGQEFDAAVGRFVLMYTGDVPATLRAVTDRVRPGGVIAFGEADFTSVLGYVRAGPSDLIRSVWEWAVDAFQQAGVHTAMAPQLYHAFMAAGLGEPRMFLHAPLGCHPDWTGYAWATESMRSLLPLLERYGIVTAQELAVETLTERYRAEVVRTGLPFMTLPMVAAWAHKPTA